MMKERKFKVKLKRPVRGYETLEIEVMANSPIKARGVAEFLVTHGENKSRWEWDGHIESRGRIRPKANNNWRIE